MARVIVAPNAFKGSLSASKAAQAIARGFAAASPYWNIVEIPLADGGDGTCECIVQATAGQLMSREVTGPLGEAAGGFWGITGDGSTAVVEIASASGLALLRSEQLNPLKATSYGSGELIREALDAGCRTIFVGIGGSATNDAGAGLLQALGVKLLDGSGREIARGALPLLDLDRIDLTAVPARLKEIDLIVGCDVDNPLYGPRGAAYVYAPQKGASPDQLPLLDRCLRRFAAVVQRDLGLDLAGLPGGGAAGGIGAGLAVLGGRLAPGIEKIMEIAGLPRLLEQGDVHLVVSGEGEINRQSLHGKVPVGVARLARRFNIPVLILAGSVKLDPEEAAAAGISAMLSITGGPVSLAEAMERTAELLETTARSAASLLNIS